ncbi:hypothetical protein EAH75_17905 [Rhodanobacter glycinis]|uniref:Type 1 fimbrial protein n=1 Tax=Rhodanobacter glycinis TaxID=582702 RepID=A0A502F997_9GAMM|nr:hypothetical protein [Rhodanobacter glycinis]TPG06509.1 hypothetical protein EAH88_14400 [Rhodanobacter glycinis]TPG45940.1 hypothetical protein EAH75_17905 [Rhodanobacter glycinis]
MVTLIMLASASNAHAATGRITLSGAVVEPTCSTEGTHADTAGELPSAAPGRLICGKTPTDPGRSYSRTLVSLDAATVATDRLLSYFAGYANADGVGGQAKLVVRTYD